MADAEQLLRPRRGLILAPAFLFFGIEYAGDTALVVRSAALGSDALAAVVEVAAPYGLTINQDKTE
eukprot:1588519-Alexandrium_andersonii.AAC.1